MDEDIGKSSVLRKEERSSGLSQGEIRVRVWCEFCGKLGIEESNDGHFKIKFAVL
jgi:hypothetical protein